MWRKTFHPLLVYCVTGVMLLPLIWMVGTSVKPPIEYVSPTINLLPDAPTLAHYRQLIEDDILGKILNSLFVAFGSTFLALLAGFPAAYALVRLRLPKHLDTFFLLFVLVIKLSPPIPGASKIGIAGYIVGAHPRLSGLRPAIRDLDADRIRP